MSGIGSVWSHQVIHAVYRTNGRRRRDLVVLGGWILRLKRGLRLHLERLLGRLGSGSPMISSIGVWADGHERGMEPREAVLSGFPSNGRKDAVEIREVFGVFNRLDPLHFGVVV
jgi:hypothetical protein